MTTPTLLLTGFERFGAHGYNPSQHAVEAIAALPDAVPGLRMVTRVLPVTFAGVSETLPALLDELRPDAFVGLGLRGSGTQIDLERIALNLNDCQAPDNAGAQPQDEPAVPGGPGLYRSTLPLGPMLSGLQSAGVPARISNHAGAYVCNHLFYVARHTLRDAAVPCGFIHLPQVAEGGGADWTQARLNEAILLALRTLAQHLPAQAA